MNKGRHIQKELNELAPALASNAILKQYEVPAGYNAQYPEKMLANEVSPMENRNPSEYTKSSFGGSLTEKVAGPEVVNELNNVAPLLNQLDKSMPFQVPVGYFEKEIQPPVAQAGTVRMIPIGGKYWQRWAIAASLFLVLCLGAFLLNQPSESGEVYATLSSEEINTFLGAMDEQKLDNLLIENEVESEFSELLILAGRDLESSLKEVSTDELKYYLENHKTPEKGI